MLFLHSSKHLVTVLCQADGIGREELMLKNFLETFAFLLVSWYNLKFDFGWLFLLLSIHIIDLFLFCQSNMITITAFSWTDYAKCMLMHKTINYLCEIKCTRSFVKVNVSLCFFVDMFWDSLPLTPSGIVKVSLNIKDLLGIKSYKLVNICGDIESGLVI